MTQLVLKVVVIYYLEKNLGEEIKVRRTWKKNKKKKTFCLTEFSVLTP